MNNTPKKKLPIVIAGVVVVLLILVAVLLLSDPCSVTVDVDVETGPAAADETGGDPIADGSTN